MTFTNADAKQMDFVFMQRDIEQYRYLWVGCWNRLMAAESFIEEIQDDIVMDPESALTKKYYAWVASKTEMNCPKI